MQISLWYLALAVVVLGLVFYIPHQRARRRERRINEYLARGVFYHSEMRLGQKIWCRTTHGYVYEIEFFERQKGFRLYQIRKLYLDENDRQHSELKPEPVVFRHIDICVGSQIVCNPSYRSAEIAEISLRILCPTRVKKEPPKETPPIFPPLRAV